MDPLEYQQALARVLAQPRQMTAEDYPDIERAPEKLPTAPVKRVAVKVGPVSMVDRTAMPTPEEQAADDARMSAIEEADALRKSAAGRPDMWTSDYIKKLSRLEAIANGLEAPELPSRGLAVR